MSTSEWMWKGWEEKSLSTCLIPKPYIISSHFSLMISRLQRTEIHGIEITAPKFTQLKKAAGIGSQHCWSHSCLPLDILVHAHVCCQWWVLNCQVPHLRGLDESAKPWIWAFVLMWPITLSLIPDPVIPTTDGKCLPGVSVSPYCWWYCSSS